MSQRSRRSVRKTTPSPAAWARLRAAIAAATETVSTYDRRRFAWSFLTTLSALSLATQQPALAQDAVPEDWKRIPREPENGSASQRGFGPSRGSLDPEGRKASVPKILLAANDPPSTGSKQPFDIPAGDLDTALIAFSRQSGVQIVSSSEVVAGLHTPGVQGNFTVREALQLMLADTGLQYRFTNPTSLTLHRTSHSDNREVPDEKPVKVQEVLIREKRELTPAVDSPDGYKADVASEAVLRFPAPIQELPQSVSIVTKDSIRDRRAVTQQQALEGIAGIGKAPQYGALQSDTYVIRGFAATLNAPGYTRDNGLSAFNNYVADPTLYERIEVIKGPASFTSGLVTAGGFVNRLLKAPQRENFVISEFGAGSYGHYRTTLDANGVMPTLPLAGRLVMTYNDDPEFFRNTGNQRLSFLPSIRLATDNDFTLTVTGNVQRLRGKGYYGTPTNTQGMIPAGIEDSLLANDNQLKIDYRSLHVEADKRFAQGFRLRVKGQYSKDESSYRYGYGYQANGIGPDGNFYIYGFGRDWKRESFAGEVNLTKEFSLFGNISSVAAGMDLSLGRQGARSAPFVSLGTGNLANPQVNTPFPPGFTNPAQTLLRDLNFNQTGAFVQGLLRPLAGTTVMLAVRQNWITQKGESAFTGGAGNERGLHVSRLTPQIGVSQRVIEGLNVYAVYGESIQPNLNVTANGALLDPMTGKTVEVGSKWEPLGGRARITAALFRTELEDVAARDPAAPTFFIGGQSQRNQGFEFEAQGALLPQLQVSLAYTFLEAEITKSTIATLVGTQVYNVPKHTVSAFASYDLSELLFPGLKIGGVVFYRSEVLPITGDQNRKFDGYTRADLFAIYAPLKWLSFQLNVNNVFNTRYVEGPFSYSGYNHFGAPRHVIGMLRMTF